MLPLLVAAMSFLAALAFAGALAAAGLAGHWQDGAATAVTVQVPQPDPPRVAAVMAVLQTSPDVASARLLGRDELTTLLRPWLGTAGDALPLPAVIEMHVPAGGAGQAKDLARLAQKLEAAAPGTRAESHEVWAGRLSVLARSLQACAWAALLLVGMVAAAVVMVATRAGLAARRDAIEIVHGLGATDRYIAGRFARRISRMAALGGLLGALLALPVLFALTDLATPFMSGRPEAATLPAQFLATLAAGMTVWLALPVLPVAAGLIGFLTAQATVRRWLRKLP